MSQELRKSISRATGLPWKEQDLGSAVTVTPAVAWALARSGLAYSVSILKTGKYVSTASRQPAMMIGLRPILSDNVPKTTKKGVPISSAAAIIRLAVVASTLS